MITLDQSRGSGELLRYFTPFGIPTSLGNLVPTGGDAWFMGKGKDGEDLTIVVERKRISDLVDSMVTNRLKGFQLPLMQENYDKVYIIVEGMYRPGSDGSLLELRHGTWKTLGVMYRQVDNFMTSLGHHTDGVKRSSTPQETVCQIVNLYRYYTQVRSKRSAIYSPELGVVKPGQRVLTRVYKTTWPEKFAYILPGIDSKTTEVARHFGTIRRAVNAKPDEWKKIKGIGKVTAENIQRALDAEGSDL